MVYLITLLTSNDQPWDTYSTSIASGWETALSLICASVPGLKPAFDRAFPKMFPSTNSGSRRTNALAYEMSATKSRIGRGGRGFENLSSRRDVDGDSSSTAAINNESSIKVQYDYHVRSSDKSDVEN